MPLTSQERSGTPIETRGPASAAGIAIGDLFDRGASGAAGRGGPGFMDTGTGVVQPGAAPGGAAPGAGIAGVPGGGLGRASALQRLGNQAQQNLLATQFGDQNLRQILGGALADPADRTAGLFSSLEPFEEQETARQVGGLRGALGSAGGRFSRNLLEAEQGLRGGLADQFRRSREQSLLEAGGLRNQAIQSVLQGLLGAQQVGAQQTGQALDFIRPGPPVIEQGILPGLLQAGAQLGTAGLLTRGQDGTDPTAGEPGNSAISNFGQLGQVASLIPGPQQPFLAAGSSLLNMFG